LGNFCLGGALTRIFPHHHAEERFVLVSEGAEEPAFGVFVCAVLASCVKKILAICQKAVTQLEWLGALGSWLRGDGSSQIDSLLSIRDEAYE